MSYSLLELNKYGKCHYHPTQIPTVANPLVSIPFRLTNAERRQEEVKRLTSTQLYSNKTLPYDSIEKNRRDK